jgi:hypothetical protein
MTSPRPRLPPVPPKTAGAWLRSRLQPRRDATLRQSRHEPVAPLATHALSRVKRSAWRRGRATPDARPKQVVRIAAGKKPDRRRRFGLRSKAILVVGEYEGIADRGSHGGQRIGKLRKRPARFAGWNSSPARKRQSSRRTENMQIPASQFEARLQGIVPVGGRHGPHHRLPRAIPTHKHGSRLRSVPKAVRYHAHCAPSHAKRHAPAVEKRVQLCGCVLRSRTPASVIRQTPQGAPRGLSRLQRSY